MSTFFFFDRNIQRDWLSKITRLQTEIVSARSFLFLNLCNLTIRFATAIPSFLMFFLLKLFSYFSVSLFSLGGVKLKSGVDEKPRMSLTSRFPAAAVWGSSNHFIAPPVYDYILNSYPFYTNLSLKPSIQRGVHERGYWVCHPPPPFPKCFFFFFWPIQFKCWNIWTLILRISNYPCRYICKCDFWFDNVSS